MDIETHQYKEDDFAVDFKQFDEVNIKGVYWAQDPDLPDQHKKIHEGGHRKLCLLLKKVFAVKPSL